MTDFVLFCLAMIAGGCAGLAVGPFVVPRFLDYLDRRAARPPHVPRKETNR